jgi:hypothetical protein
VYEQRLILEASGLGEDFFQNRGDFQELPAPMSCHCWDFIRPNHWKNDA